jgi:ABC-type dipeptide/oligopeptide/nickel transport system permease component
VFIFILIFLTFAFIADVLYTIVDPRVRLSGYKGTA